MAAVRETPQLQVDFGVARVVEGDGMATLSFGIPQVVGAPWFDPQVGEITCRGELKSYDIRWHPRVRVLGIETLDSVEFPVEMR